MAQRKDEQGWADGDTAVLDPVDDTVPAIAAIVSDVAAGLPPQEALDLEHFKLGPTGLIVKGRPSIHEWQSVGDMLRLFEHGVQWLIGDWLCYGEGMYGELAAQAVDATQWAPETVRVYRWVASKVPHQNRVPQLKFSHHQVCAELSVTDQALWLGRALKNEWSVATLKAQMQAKLLGEEKATKYLVVVTCESEDDQQACGRQLEALGRSYAIKEPKA